MAFDFNFSFGKRKAIAMDEITREETRVQLLQDVSRIEGRVSVTNKVGIEDFNDLLSIVREIIALK